MTLISMAKDLVHAQIARGQLPPEEMSSLLTLTHGTLQQLQSQEELVAESAAIAVAPEAEAAVDWRKSITKHAVTCLECGASFRQLSSRHLRTHDLDARSYRRKYGIPSTQSLSSRQATP